MEEAGRAGAGRPGRGDRRRRARYDRSPEPACRPRGGTSDGSGAACRGWPVRGAANPFRGGGGDGFPNLARSGSRRDRRRGRVRRAGARVAGGARRARLGGGLRGLAPGSAGRLEFPAFRRASGRGGDGPDSGTAFRGGFLLAPAGPRVGLGVPDCPARWPGGPRTRPPPRWPPPPRAGRAARPRFPAILRPFPTPPPRKPRRRAGGRPQPKAPSRST